MGTEGTGPFGRAYYSGTYYDLADRPIADVNVGTNGGTAWVMPATVPNRSDTVLVTSYGYSAAGFQDSATDPAGLVDQQTLDALGRVTQDVQDYTDGTPTNDSNQTTQYTYDGDNNVLTVTAVQPTGRPSRPDDPICLRRHDGFGQRDQQQRLARRDALPRSDDRAAEHEPGRDVHVQRPRSGPHVHRPQWHNARLRL